MEDWSYEADCQVWRLTQANWLCLMDAIALAILLGMVLITVAVIMDDE